jgi:hypothetical protein
MSCKNHPDVAAVDRCTGCAETFCGNCLVEVRGQKYCALCKVMVFQGQPIALEGATRPCKEAGEALTLSIFSLFCFGIILGPLAISKGLKARKLINEDLRLTGFGKANAAIAIGTIALVVWLVSIAGKAMKGANY